MSSVEKSIAVCARGNSRSFKKILAQVSETYPKHHRWWQLGVAVHIKCMRDSMGVLEYTAAFTDDDRKVLYEEHRVPELGLGISSITRIKHSTIVNKYNRYNAYVDNAT